MKSNLLPIVILISGNGSNLQAIIDKLHGKYVDIRAVISNRDDAFGLERAKHAGIPTDVLPNKAFNSKLAYDQALLACIDHYKPQLVILAGFMRILGPELVQNFYGRMLNIHPSLLPHYPGLHTHQRVREAGDAFHGATVHFVTEKLDGGPAVAYAKIPVSLDDTAATLQSKVHNLEHKLYPEVIKWFAQGRLQLEQDKVLLNGKVISLNGMELK